VETVKYNSVTSKPDIRMDMTIIYLHKSSRFKYLDSMGSNIKLQSSYFISELFRFSKSGKIMIEAIDINYLRPSAININISESSSSIMANALSIIDIIDDDINSLFDNENNIKKSANSSKNVNLQSEIEDQEIDREIDDQKIDDQEID
ncbi:1912_t:CDS:2, partial [Racocetra fulgida]